MDFYDKLRLYKSKRKLKWSTLGEAIHMNGDAFRMAVNRRSFSDLEINELKNKFAFEQNEQIGRKIDITSFLNEEGELYQKLDKNLYNQILQNSIKNIEESAKATLDSIKIIKDLLR